MVWKMVRVTLVDDASMDSSADEPCNSDVSWLGEMWSLMLRTLYYICCMKLQNCLLLWMDKANMSVINKAHHFVCHWYNFFHVAQHTHILFDVRLGDQGPLRRIINSFMFCFTQFQDSWLSLYCNALLFQHCQP